MLPLPNLVVLVVVVRVSHVDNHVAAGTAGGIRGARGFVENPKKVCGGVGGVRILSAVAGELVYELGIWTIPGVPLRLNLGLGVRD
jgi:hypothetical protein